MTELYKNIEKYVFDSFRKAGRIHEVLHLIRTLHWLEKLKPDVDEALRIAAISHDIERAFRRKDVKDIVKKPGGLTSKIYFKKHEIRGAKIMAGCLEKHGAKNDFINRVKMLVSRHEQGGNDDQNLLKDADSIGFFEIYANSELISKMIRHIGKKEAKRKIDFMYDRITSNEAKRITKKWYDKMIADLETYE